MKKLVNFYENQEQNIFWKWYMRIIIVMIIILTIRQFFI